MHSSLSETAQKGIPCSPPAHPCAPLRTPAHPCAPLRTPPHPSAPLRSFVSQNWTVALGLPETQSWRPWTLDGCKRMGGYVTRYEGDFDFLTIRGSGHMVPQVRGIVG